MQMQIELDHRENPVSLSSTVTATSDSVSVNLGDEAVILQLKQGVYYGLDPIGTKVWSMIQKPRRVDTILTALLQEHDVEPGRCARDLLSLCQDMKSRELIVVQDAATV